MKVSEIIEQADDLVGNSVTAEGFIIVLERARTKIAYLSSPQNLGDPEQQQIAIEHSLAELKTIIRPLPSLQLLFRGTLIDPPYFYRFPATIVATVDMDAENHPILKRITQLSIDVPYSGKTGETTRHDHYQYDAKIDYTPVQVEGYKKTARAIVKSQKYLLLVEKPVSAEQILKEENRYARRITNQMIRVHGWLETTSSKNDIMKHLLFLTTSLRSSVVAVGPLRDATIVWLRPSYLDQLLKTHMNRQPEQPMHQIVEVIGKIDYLQDEDVPTLGDKSPKLVFTEIASVILHDIGYLW